MSQTTIQKSVRCTGIGLHSGKQVEMVLRPAAEDTGILFSLRNGSGSTFLTPAPSLVVETALATVLGDGRETVATVEHLLAAIHGMGVDNIHIEVLGKELPIMDGSAASFVYLLKQAGIHKLNKPRKVIGIKKAVEFEQDGKYIKARPHDGLCIDYTIEFAHPLIGRQHMELEITPDNFAKKVAKARTFGFLKEVDYLHANGLALGGSLDNAVVLDEYTILNSEGLRFTDEFVRHKILDFVGDMAILGAPLHGHFEVFASGHALNNAFLRHLDGNRDLYLEEKIIPLPDTATETLGRECVQPVPAVA
ncbi:MULTISPECIES: UDP-3-O-acyl-N-acetylglucosamine deacetylase [unclassified Pseudodesulfovibrio]|uniref:UDP-3-O-acyl-N-acetylglucosamine deacetylase n=1 Tax=unclassified Pseudodesulfovibrio TaxID=2661612 RepID=UPI000FEB86E8|nr:MULTISPECIES: UDP-3-O-acyl-N-acetylglucosamine deacetylase [unclassified Pseudodesulfovibrio]MCJ2164037.1 UDP-3-O-acyl-N-acetylglucosamine deacetylase [Pseudodesulfovibrio sp. S3-i]RWU05327.1 UDP-3-O-acyl-N-acetylglucosamine deacetylase [Pseudodesulfovibrio sp. S3]